VRPATSLICEFIDKHKQGCGVVPICRALAVHGVQIAPRTYWAHRSAAPAKRALWDTTITEVLAGIYEPGIDGRRPPESLYGSLKMWAHLQRDNGLAETTIGLYKTECTRDGSPFRHGPLRTLADLEHITCAWVAWFGPAGAPTRPTPAYGN
jgi:hypothetical protein